MEKLQDGTVKKERVVIMGYELTLQSRYVEDSNEFYYAFGIYVDDSNKLEKYAPSMEVSTTWESEEYPPKDDKRTRIVKIQTTAQGALTQAEYRKFMEANQQAYFASQEIQKEVDLFVAYHEKYLDKETGGQ